MVKKTKKLGMGLDLLLAAGEMKAAGGRDRDALQQARETMELALREDDAGNVFEAYYLYRKVMDQTANISLEGQDELMVMLSKACNNAAIILYEQGRVLEARAFLHKSLTINPQNVTAKENLDQLGDSFINSSKEGFGK